MEWLVKNLEVDHKHANKLAEEMLLEGALRGCTGKNFVTGNLYQFV